MRVAKMRIVSLTIMLAFVRVNQAPPEIHCWAVFRFNIVRAIVSVHRAQFVKLEFVRRFVHRIVNVSPINRVCKAFANRLVTITQLVLISNSVKTIFAHKKFDAEATMIACLTKNAKSIHPVVRNVETLVKDAFCAVAMLNVQHEITMVCVHVNKALLMMAKADADESNVKMIMNAVRINSVIKIFANWRVKVEKHAAIKPFAQSKITDPLVTANQDIAEIHTNNVMQSIIAATLHADRALYAQTIKELSIVLVVMALLAIHTMKDAVWLSNAQAIRTAHQVPNVFSPTVIQNVEMFAKMSAADRIPNVYRSIMLPSANAYQATVVKRPTQLLDADHCQLLARCQLIAQPIRTATVEYVSQHVFWIKSAI